MREDEKEKKMFRVRFCVVGLGDFVKIIGFFNLYIKNIVKLIKTVCLHISYAYALIDNLN